MGIPFLTEILGFRPEAIKELAAEEGIDLKTLNPLKRHKVSAEQLRKCLGETEGRLSRKTNCYRSVVATPYAYKALREKLEQAANKVTIPPH